MSGGVVHGVVRGGQSRPQPETAGFDEAAVVKVCADELDQDVIPGHVRTPASSHGQGDRLRTASCVMAFQSFEPSPWHEDLQHHASFRLHCLSERAGPAPTGPKRRVYRLLHFKSGGRDSE